MPIRYQIQCIVLCLSVALFGTGSLAWAQTTTPPTVKDLIQGTPAKGAVEEIGLRSTRLRLLDGNQATIPNEVLARVDTVNVVRRPPIRRIVNIGIP
jgi:small-conductance mechanosensitive channel